MNSKIWLPGTEQKPPFKVYESETNKVLLDTEKLFWSTSGTLDVNLIP